MNALQRCPSSADCVPLYLAQQLYLRPTAKIMISLQLPNLKKIGKSISHWEIMDNLRVLAKPDEFTLLKVSKTTVEFVRFEAEIEKRSKLERVISKLDNKMIKLKDFGELMRVRAAEYRSDFPNRRTWDAFFSESRDMDEMKPGERPDTIHIANLPTKWFVPYHLSNDDEAIPSEKIFYRIFEKFGSIRFVDIPLADPYRKKMKDHISGLKYSSFDKPEIFEGYVQFKDYVGFTKTMDAFRDMKLVHKDDEGDFEIDIKVDFDKSKHLSDASIRRREIVRDRLVKKAKEQEERDKKKLEEKKKQEDLERQRELDLKNQKEIRRKLREEKRKAKVLKKLEITGSDEINEKIAREEKKLIKVQRKLEAIRIVEELFRRVKDKLQENVHLYDGLPNPSKDALTRYKNTSELALLTQREKLHNVVKGRAMLKTILSDGQKARSFSSSSSEPDLSDSDEQDRYQKAPLKNSTHPAELMYDGQPSPWFGYPGYNDVPYHFVPPPTVFHEYPMPPEMYYHRSRGRGGILGPRPGPSRGGMYQRRPRGAFVPRNRGGYRGGNNRRYDPAVEEEYKRYFEKFLNERDHRARDDRSRSGSRRRSYSRSRSRSRHRSKSRSRSRSRSRSKSRSRRSRSRRSRSYRSRSRSYSSERSRSRGRSRRDSDSRRRRTKSPTPRTPRRRSRTKERSSTRRTNDKSEERSRRSGERSGRSEERSRRSQDRSRRSEERSRRSEERSRRSGERSERNRSVEKGSKSEDHSNRSHRSEERSGISENNGKPNEHSAFDNRTQNPNRDSKEKSRERNEDELKKRSRSRSWSMPKEDEQNKRSSWSRSPENSRKTKEND